MKVNTMAEMIASGQTPEVLFWVGCAGSFDQRAQKITKAFATILDKAGVNYAILGKEEACTGDPARRAAAIVKSVTFFDDAKVLAEQSKGLGEAMVGINVADIPAPHRLAERGW